MSAATKTAVKTSPQRYEARLKTLYRQQYAKELMKELKLANPHEVPKLEKIVLNVGLGRAKEEKKTIEVATNTLLKISGQRPIATIAKQSIAAFKLREGQIIGLKVTLRGDRMYEILDRFINIVLPRVRDFHGVSSKSFDASGNFSVGLPDQSVFPELTFDETTTVHGLQAIFVVTCLDKAHAKAALEKFGMPFEKPVNKPADKESK